MQSAICIPKCLVTGNKHQKRKDMMEEMKR